MVIFDAETGIEDKLFDVVDEVDSVDSVVSDDGDCSFVSDDVLSSLVAGCSSLASRFTETARGDIIVDEVVEVVPEPAGVDTVLTLLGDGSDVDGGGGVVVFFCRDCNELIVDEVVVVVLVVAETVEDDFSEDDDVDDEEAGAAVVEAVTLDLTRTT